ncbi:MAG: RING finger protein [Acutalibacteraceae bacterium]
MDTKHLENEKCPVCYSRFFEEDDIVYCPVCGCPHHRDCYNRIGHCRYEEFHNTDKQWKPSEYTESSNSDDTDNQRGSSFCSNCRQKIEPTALFCPRCGCPVNNKSGSSQDQNQYQQYGWNPNAQRQNQNPMGGSPFGQPFSYYGGQNVVYAPLGGVNPNEDLGGASAIDCTSFIKTNTIRFIPKFSKMNREKKKTSWNWCAFLFPEYYFLYRKCYYISAIAIAAYIVVLILQCPVIYWMQNLPISGDTVTYSNLFQAAAANISSLSTVNIILLYCGIAFLIIYHIIFGIFGDYFIKRHCIEKINSFKNNPEIEDYQTMIAIKGGVNFFAPVIGYMLIEMLFVIVQQFMFASIL